MFSEYLMGSSHPLGKKAYAIAMGEKLAKDGYCNIECFIKKNLTRVEIKKKLKEMNSHCVTLYDDQAPQNLTQAQETVNSFFDSTRLQPDTMSSFEAFCIVDWCFKSMNSMKERQLFIMQMLAEYNENEAVEEIRFTTPILFFQNKVEIHIFSSLDQYSKLLKTLEEGMEKNRKCYFRGHSAVNYRLYPSVFRQTRWMENESKMYQELLIHCPGNFKTIHSYMERLALMQHYGLPTRLLDITQNPLVALFFACEGEEQAGEVVLLSVPKTGVKYTHSDIVTILSNLPLFDFQTQKIFYQLSCQHEKDIGVFNSNPHIKKLLHQIKMEKPAFDNVMKPGDLRRNVVVSPLKNNDRLVKQDGAFILFGLSHPGYEKDSGLSVQRDAPMEELRFKTAEGKKVILICNKKDGLEKELKRFAVNKANLFPEMDTVADFIKNNVETL